MPATEVIVTRGPKSKNSDCYKQILLAVLSEAEKYGTWRMAAQKAESSKSDGTFFVRSHDSRGITVLMQPNGKDSGFLWDVLPPSEYDTDEVFAELQSWNGFRFTPADEIITSEELSHAKVFRQKESEWKQLEHHKKEIEDQITKLYREIEAIDIRMAELTEAIVRDHKGQKAWAMLKKALDL